MKITLLLDVDIWLIEFEPENDVDSYIVDDLPNKVYYHKKRVPLVHGREITWKEYGILVQNTTIYLPNTVTPITRENPERWDYLSSNAVIMIEGMKLAKWSRDATEEEYYLWWVFRRLVMMDYRDEAGITTFMLSSFRKEKIDKLNLIC